LTDLLKGYILAASEVKSVTWLLTQAFNKAARLSDDLQDQLARQLLDEIEGESRWDRTLAESAEQLDQLAEKAEQEYRAGNTREIGFDEL